MSSYHVELQDWQRWPRVLVMTHRYTVGHNNHTEQRRYLPERTCHSVIGEGDFVCSECGAFMHARNAYVGESHVDEDGVRWYGNSYEHNFNYCPNCGARIEVEE